MTKKTKKKTQSNGQGSLKDTDIFLSGFEFIFVFVYLFSQTFSAGLFSGSFLFFSELDLLLLLLLLLEDEELEEDLESCLLKLSFDTDPLDTSIS